MVKLNGKLALTLCTAVILATMTIFASTDTAFAGCGWHIEAHDEKIDERCENYSPGCHVSPEPRWKHEEKRKIEEIWYDENMEQCDKKEWEEWRSSGNCCEK